MKGIQLVKAQRLL